MRKSIFQRTNPVLATLALCAIPILNADATLTFTGSSGNLSAQADFELVNSTLTVTLANTSTSDVQVPTDILQAILFNTAHTLTPVSASLNGGSTVHYGSLVNNVGEGWQYNSGFAAHGMNSGISASGLGIFGNSGWFYQLPVTPLDGTDYGILSAGDNSATGNTGVTGHGPLIKNEIVFKLTAADGFTLDELGDSVVFQYGTDLKEPSFDGSLPVPEASTIIAGALLLLPLGASTLRILRRRTV